MQNIKLDSRLSAVASLVRKGSVVADVGTDHAYIPVFLVEEGISPYAVACDINEGPLENAYKNIAEHGLCDKIETVLSDGLDSLSENCADDIIIAGMGGILISDILSRCQWIRNSNIRIIAQPMTHAEKVREFFIKNGFIIKEETATEDSRHKYCIIVAEYEGVIHKYPEGYVYYGKLPLNKDRVSKDFLNIQKKRLLKRYNALLKTETSGEEREYLSRIIGELTDVLEEM